MLFLSKGDLEKIKCDFCKKESIKKNKDKFVCVNCGMIYEEWELWDMLAEKSFRNERG